MLIVTCDLIYTGYQSIHCVLAIGIRVHYFSTLRCVYESVSVPLSVIGDIGYYTDSIHIHRYLYTLYRANVTDYLVNVDVSNHILKLYDYSVI